MANAVESMTGMKSGKRKTHRGKRGGKSHSAPPKHAVAPQVPAPDLAALLGGNGAAPSPMAAPGGPDPAVAHLIAALGALHGQGQPQPQAAPPMLG